MKNFAVIDNETNRVVNKILAETQEIADQSTINEESSSSYTCVEYVVVEIDDLWNGTTFTKS